MVKCSKDTEIKRLSLSDLDNTIELFQEAFKDDHIYNECEFSISAGLPNSFKNSIKYSIENGISFGYFINAKLIGFILAFDYNDGMKNHYNSMKEIFEMQDSGESLYGDELSILFDEAKKHNSLYYIMSIAVKNEYRQKGIASSLLDKLMESTNNADIISDVSSMISIPMYIKRQFKIEDIENDYKLVVLSRKIET